MPATPASVTVPRAGVWLLAVVAPVEEVAVFAVAGPRGHGRRSGGSPSGRRSFPALAVLVLAATGQVLLPALLGPGYDAALVPAPARVAHRVLGVRTIALPAPRGT